MSCASSFLCKKLKRSIISDIITIYKKSRLLKALSCVYLRLIKIIEYSVTSIECATVSPSKLHATVVSLRHFVKFVRICLLIYSLLWSRSTMNDEKRDVDCDQKITQFIVSTMYKVDELNYGIVVYG